MLLRSALHARGPRFRKDHPIRAGDVRVRADVVFTRRRLAVFVDGCWHACPEHGHPPRSNQPYWIPKLEPNVRRDARVDAALRAHDWQVRRFWEHDDPDAAAAEVAALLAADASGVHEPARPDRGGSAEAV